MKEIVVKQHDDGTWYARPYMGVNKVTGKPWRPYRRFPDARTEEEATAMAREWASTLSGAADLQTSTRLVDVLTRYIELNEHKWRTNTAKAYRKCLRAWIAPNVGNIDVDELRPHLVDALYNILFLRGGVAGGKLGASSVIQVHDFLCGAFKWIVKCEISPFNPMPSVTKPAPDAGDAVAFDEEDFTKLHAAIVSALEGEEGTMRHMTALAAYLALNAGLRVGETCALLVRDVNLSSRFLRVSATVVEPDGRPPERQLTTKGKKTRNVSLSADACKTIERQLAWRSTVLPPVVSADRRTPLCCNGKGGLLRPSAVSREFSAMRDELGLAKGTTFHTLRHTHATYLIASGVDLRTVGERLGHSKASTTLELYAHAMPGRDEAAAQAFSEITRRVAGNGQ